MRTRVVYADPVNERDFNIMLASLWPDRYARWRATHEPVRIEVINVTSPTCGCWWCVTLRRLGDLWARLTRRVR